MWYRRSEPAVLLVRSLLVVAAVILTALPATLSGQGLGRDDYLDLLSLSFRASQRFAITYHARTLIRNRVRCYDLTVYRDSDATEGVGAPPSFPCEGASGPYAPREAPAFVRFPTGLEDDNPSYRWLYLPEVVRRLGPRSSVREVESRTIAGLNARCFDMGDDSVRAAICLEPESSVVLSLDLNRGAAGYSVRAVRMTGHALPPGPADPDVKLLANLLVLGLESTYTVDFELRGSRWTYARSGGVLDYQSTDLKGWSGGSVEIFDGEARIVCSGEGSAASCKRTASASRFNVFERRDAVDGHLTGMLIARLLGDPDAEVIERAPRTIADRPARCFETRTHQPDNGGFGTTWTRAWIHSISVCLDRELGALLYAAGGGESGSATYRLVATRLIPSADPELFKPPYPVTP